MGRQLDPAMPVEVAVAGPTRKPDFEDASFLDRFWFDADAQRAPIGMLSGGERRRLQLVLTLRDKPNVVFLDEPTNDLVDTLRVLEEVLVDWPGAVVVASHDRAFLERTVTEVVVLGDGRPVRRAPGGYAGWAAEHQTGRSPGRAVAAGPRAVTTTVARRPGPPLGPAPPAPPRVRSPYTLRRLIREAEREVNTLEQRRSSLVDALAIAGADRDALARIGTELAAVEAELEAAEDRWVTLDDGSDAT